ncbi:MAG: hypothetical protein KDA42_07130 [Planctomycetales bacterium]|nr:hypothetical protein [Planctomycetales bacterium]
MSNPYEPPETDPRDSMRFVASAEGIYQRGMIGHIRVVAILMMIQGVLELVMGVFLGVMAAIMPSMMQNMQQMQNPNQGVPIAQVSTMVTVMYGVMALVLGAVGGLTAFAGFRNYQLRARVLGIVSMCLGLLTVFGCYCFPTALALMVYGLIVYLNQPVAMAFDRVANGESVADVLLK